MSLVPTFNALIKTHHITSRKKVASLKKAATKLSCYTLLRSGGCPGIMYCEGDEASVRQWVATVQKLRYKDYYLLVKPAPVRVENQETQRPQKPGFFEVPTVKQFASEMEGIGILLWWKEAMGFINPGSP